MRTRYITTTLPYVNADPHIGFALELVHADVMARYYRGCGDRVFFNTGTDEHGLKIYRGAVEAHTDPKSYVDTHAKRFVELKSALYVLYDNFIRTTDTAHEKSAQEFWQKCAANGDIYKKAYKVKYCVGCELEKTDSELEGGVCPLHPKTPLEYLEEENYFFRFSRYQNALLKLYDDRPDFVYPAHRLSEVREFVKRGLEDFSISRLKSKLPWGVPVPGDPDHVMYVWFDALVNYVSAIGWPHDMERFETWWPVVQLAGKDNLRQQAAMWQAMLMSVGLPSSERVLIHGFLLSGGEKISKSTGNTVDPIAASLLYSADVLRSFLVADVPTYEDGDYTDERFRTVYNARFANGIGNLGSRLSAMITKSFSEGIARPDEARSDAFPMKSGHTVSAYCKDARKRYEKMMEKYEFGEAAKIGWGLVEACDGYIQQHEPYRMVREHKDDAAVVLWNVGLLFTAGASLLESVIPETASRALGMFGVASDSDFVSRPIVALTGVPPIFPRRES